jgi:dolichol-phosphate mannosyltransferase
LSRRVVDELCKLKETNGFLRGLVAFVGFEQGFIEYNRDKRYDGSGKYNRFFGSLKIAFNGLVVFSNFLLSFVFALGLLVFVMAVIGITYIFVAKFYLGHPFPMGTPILIVLVLLMGGTQLIAVGILGEYIGRIYDEVKQRPTFIIDEKRVILPEPY